MANPDKIIKKKNIPVFFEKFGRNYHLLSQNIRTILAGTSLLGHTVIYYFICPTKEMPEEWSGVHASPLPDFGRSVTLSKPEGTDYAPHITTLPHLDYQTFRHPYSFLILHISDLLWHSQYPRAIEYVPRGLNTSNGKI